MLWLWILLILLATLAGVVAVRTLKCKPPETKKASDYRPSDDLTVPRKLAEAVRIATISRREPEKTDEATFLRFHALLEKQFPLVHEHCEKTVVNGLSLLYRLPAASPTPGKKPVLITAHMDVVPVEAGTEGDWDHPPFSGDLADGRVWGRGTLDTKVHLIGALEAVERLLQKGMTPRRDIYLAFGADEELNGEAGAVELARLLKERGLDFDFVLDEGGCVVNNVIAGVNEPIAMVGIGEKGYANIRLSVAMDGGHASMPAKHTSLGVLAEALCRVEAHPFKPRLIPATRDFLLKLAPYMSGGTRMVLANLWLFQPLFLRMFVKTPTGGALLRTTTAVTMAQGSPAPNVVPQRASAVVNCRILPGENGQTLLAHFRKLMRGLPVTVEHDELDDPSALSPCDGEDYRLLESLIGEFCGNPITTPYLVTAGTDARKYELVCRNVYRFSPYVIDDDDLGKMHGTNENISVANVNRCADFFTALMERL